MRAVALGDEPLTVKIDFKGNHFPKSALLFAVIFCVCAYDASHLDMEEIKAERSVEIDHATLNRWVVKFSPLIAAKAQSRKKPTAPSWRMDETCIQVRGKWAYLYGAVDRNGQTTGSQFKIYPACRSFIGLCSITMVADLGVGTHETRMVGMMPTIPLLSEIN